MNEMSLGGARPDGRSLSTAEAALVGEAGRILADRQIKDARTRAKFAHAVGFAGAAIGVLGLACSLLVINRWDPGPPDVIRVSEETGRTLMSIPAADARTVFTDATSEQWLGELVERCEQYVYPIALDMSRKCAVLLSSERRKEWEAWFQSDKGPPATLKADGSLTATNVSFALAGKDERHRSEAWRVYYDLTQRLPNGGVSCEPKVLSVVFVWRPEARMSVQTRRWNQSGMQVVQYKAERDGGRATCRQ